jgi:hypothetical protein
VKKSTSDKEQATNRLLFALSQRSNGMTTRELADFVQLSKGQVVQLLRDSDYPQEGYADTGAKNMAASNWTLKKYVPGSPNDEDLKKRIQTGSLG